MEIATEIHDEAWWSMFRIFSHQHPVEAYSEYPLEFCEYVRTINPELSNEDIAVMIKMTEDEEDEKDNP